MDYEEYSSHLIFSVYVDVVMSILVAIINIEYKNSCDECISLNTAASLVNLQKASVDDQRVVPRHISEATRTRM